MIEADFNHVALHVKNVDASVAFYRKYGGMTVFNDRRGDDGSRTVWLTTSSKRTVLVLVGSRAMRLKHRIAIAIARVLPPACHLGVALAARKQVRDLCERARDEGILRREPAEHGPPVGFYGMIRDPDGNNFELSHAQTMLEILEKCS